MLLYVTVYYCILLYININTELELELELELDFVSLEQIYDLGSPVTLSLDVKLSHQIINFS